MYYGLESNITVLLFFVGVLVVFIAQIRLSTSYSKYRNKRAFKSISGFEVARAILDANGLEQILIVEVKKELSDHYDPTRKVIRLSKDVFHGTSIASIAVAAHEVGHAIQDKEEYFYMRLRSRMVPVVNFVTYIGYFVSLIALFAGIVGYLKVGIVLILATLLFQLVTLPVEFNASFRAKEQLKALKLIESSEEKEVKSMLDAAALTYVASFISSIVQLLRLVLMLQDHRDD